MMGYCPPQPKKKELDPQFQFDLSVLIPVTIAAIVACGVIAYDKSTGIFAYRRKKKARAELQSGKVPGWVLRDRDTMTFYLRELGYEPVEWRIELLTGLLTSRMATIQRKTIGQGLTMAEIKRRVVDEDPG